MSTNLIDRLVAELSRLPGIGKRSATRLAFFIVKRSQCDLGNTGTSLAHDLANALISVAEQVSLCMHCFNLSTDPACNICQDPMRKQDMLCVVENVQDLCALEATHIYKGRYHVLHGVIAPLDGIGPDELKIQALLDRLQKESIQEIILATNNDVEGDATALYLHRLLQNLNVSITRLATGIPQGGELEYLDQETIRRAFSDRRHFTEKAI